MKKIEDIEPELLWAWHWGNGYSIQECADELGCSYHTIRRLMIKYGVERHKGGYCTTNELHFKDERILKDLAYFENRKKRYDNLDFDKLWGR